MACYVEDVNRLHNAIIRAYEAIDVKHPKKCSVELYKEILQAHGFVQRPREGIGIWMYQLPRGMQEYQYKLWHGPVKKYQKRRNPYWGPIL